MKVIKIFLGTVFGLASIFFLIHFLFMFFVLALRGVYLSETAGTLLAMLIAATLTEWAFESAFRRNMRQAPPGQPGDAETTMGTRSPKKPQTFQLSAWLVSCTLMGCLCFGSLGAAYGAYLHFHPEYKEKLIHWTLSLPHPDNVQYLASAQAIRYMGFWEIVGRKALILGLFGSLITGGVGLITAKWRRIKGVEQVLPGRFLLMGLAVLLAACLLFRVGTGSGMVYYRGHNQFYWCEQLESKNGVQRRCAIQAACSLLGGKPFVCRVRMITALSNCGDDAKVAIPLLTDLLHEQDALVCTKAAWILAKLGPEGRAAVRPVVPRIRRLLQHDNVEVRTAAAEALERIDRLID